MVSCDAPLRDNGTVAYWDGLTRPADYDECPDKYNVYGEENKTLRIGYGGQKTIYKLDHQSDRVVFLGMLDHITIKEYQAIVILNAFGFISQQSPKIVDVTFKNSKSKKNIISVLSFDHLVLNKPLKTFDLANQFGFGEVSIFNGQANFYDIDYNRNLFSPLIKDLAAVYCLKGGEFLPSDSLNLIFHYNQDKQQTQCRLFIYDLYSKTASKGDFLFKDDEIYRERLSKIKDFSGISSNFLEPLYKEVLNAMSQEEKQIHCNIKCGDQYLVDYDKMKSQYNILSSYFLDVFNVEFNRLLPLFQEVCSQ